MAQKEKGNAKNAAGEPIDSNGNKIIDLKKTNEYYVTGSHPYVKDLGVGKKINVSAHTHGPAGVANGWLSETPIEDAPVKKGKKGSEA